MSEIYLEIAIPTPLFKNFDYLLPKAFEKGILKPGIRVQAPFGNRKVVGIIVAIKDHSDFPNCKPIQKILDEQPVLTGELQKLCTWAASYYHHPLGQVFSSALPTRLRKGLPAIASQTEHYHLSEAGKKLSLSALKRAPKQAVAIAQIKKHPKGISKTALKALDISSQTLAALEKKGWVSISRTDLLPENTQAQITGPTPNKAQSTAIHAINESQGFQVFLLNGITGSGKTEVYIQAIKTRLAKNQQVLILVPEIGLTPQTIKRFQSRFEAPIVSLHSNLNDQERLNAWVLAKSGKAKIIIGTRSAIFTPFKRLGLIVIDEEHDLSYKQQDNFRYHARDLSVIRAKFLKIPLVLGSATPSLETVHNVTLGKYQELRLPNRTGSAKPPQFKVIDLRNKPLEYGLSRPLISAIQSRLDKKEQVMLFLNRRGFAPVLMCHGCGWVARCHRCEANLTLHQKKQQLQCHHCQYTTPIPSNCPNCQYDELQAIGQGTERLESTIETIFPNTQIIRIDRDTTRNKGALEKHLNTIEKGGAQILIGTQMLAKGHHFPKVTLVALVSIDDGLFSTDFRALEKMGQLITQVSGRAGRGNLPGEVYLQTHHPDHPLLQVLLKEGYLNFSKQLLAERKAAQLPPYAHFALFRAQSNMLEKSMAFLKDLKIQLPNTFDCLGPIPASMPKKAGFYRAQLLIQSQNRPMLQQHIKAIQTKISDMQSAKTVKWVIDVDPMDVM